MKSDVALLNQKAVAAAAAANIGSARTQPASLQETIELARFLRRALENYSLFAPVTSDPHAKEIAKMRGDECLIQMTRGAIEEDYRGDEASRKRLIEREIARLEDDGQFERLLQ